MELDTSKITNMSAVEFTPLPSKLWGKGGTGAVPRGAPWALCGSSTPLSRRALRAHIHTRGGEQCINMERGVHLSQRVTKDAHCWAGSSPDPPCPADTSQPIAVLGNAIIAYMSAITPPLSLQLVSSTGAVRCA